MTEAMVQALLSPAAYSHAVSDVRLLETHISWVLLTGDYAYKIKKPVNFGFLDFSTVARRKHCCDEELRLNSRFSSGLYLAVVSITGTAASPRMDGPPAADILDYAVKMRQFDQQDLLESLAADERLDSATVAALATKLAAFHQHGAERLAAADSTLGSFEAVAGAALDNFRQIAPRLQSQQERAALEQLRQWTAQQLDDLRAVFLERRAQGFVRECHGDLHLRNIARIDGEITFFDCIEFNPQLRWIDVQSELAFVLMDMEEKQLSAESNRLLNIYLEQTGDYAGLAVLRFYKVYRAMVRAKVGVLQLDSGTLSAAGQEAVWRQYATYVALAQSFCEPPQAFLGLMHGVSGTGKSTVAATLAAEFAAIRIRSDVERKRLFGLPPDARSDLSARPQLYGEETSQRTFSVLEALARSLLELGYPVLVDATFIAEKWRRPFRQLAEETGLPFLILDCQASAATIQQRLALRESSQHDASEAGIEVMREQRAKLEPFSAAEQPHVVAIDTERSLAFESIRMALEKEVRRSPH